MKNKLSEHGDLLLTFIGEMEVLLNNPYSSGIDIKRLLIDLRGYGNQLLTLIEDLPDDENELPDDETEEPETAE